MTHEADASEGGIPLDAPGLDATAETLRVLITGQQQHAQLLQQHGEGLISALVFMKDATEQHGRHLTAIEGVRRKAEAIQGQLLAAMSLQLALFQALLSTDCLSPAAAVAIVEAADSMLPPDTHPAGSEALAVFRGLVGPKAPK